LTIQKRSIKNKF